MGDLAMGLIVLSFFGICVAYVTWCNRIIGPDDEGGALDALADHGDAKVMSGVSQ